MKKIRVLPVDFALAGKTMATVSSFQYGINYDVLNDRAEASFNYLDENDSVITSGTVLLDTSNWGEDNTVMEARLFEVANVQPVIE